jgi:CNT family concentrative nucleoside transporter
MDEIAARAMSGVGFVSMIGIAFLLSENRKRIAWRTVGVGIAIQLALAAVLLWTPAGRLFFDVSGAAVGRILAWTNAGTRFLFGPLAEGAPSFVFGVLPVIIFLGSVFSILYHVGALPWLVRVLSKALSRGMRLSGAESLAAVSNVVVGMVESTLIVKPYVSGMTRSELFTTMSLGMATVAGSVLVAYVQFLGGGDFAGHLITASLMSAPAGVLIAKIMVPETGTPATAGGAAPDATRTTANLIDAAAEGALSGLRLAAYVGATLLAFVALIAMANDGIGAVGGLFGHPALDLQTILGWLLAPLAFLMGVPWQDAAEVGALLGLKTVLNEFLAYQALGEMIAAGTLEPRSQVIASYALCGFANFGSLAILLGGLTGIAPERRGEAARLGLRTIVAGSLATFMTGCVAGVFIGG